MRQQLSLDRPLIGLRVCRPASASASASASAGAVELSLPSLLGLRDRMGREEDARQALIKVCSDIQGAAGQIIPMVDCNLRSVTELATELGLAIAREVVGHAVDEGLFDPSPVVLQCLRDSVRAGGAAGDRGPAVRVELSPDDLNLVISRLESDPEVRSMVAEVDFVADAGLGRGCATVSTNGGRLVYDPEEVLQRIATEIRKSASEAPDGVPAGAAAGVPQ